MKKSGYDKTLARPKNGKPQSVGYLSELNTQVKKIMRFYKTEPIYSFVKGGGISLLVVVIVAITVNLCFRFSGTSTLVPHAPFIVCMIIYAIAYIFSGVTICRLQREVDALSHADKEKRDL